MILRLLRGDVDFTGTPNFIDVITLSGRGTIGAVDTHVIACSYRPSVPTLDIQRERLQGRDGERVRQVTQRNVTEACQLFIEETAGLSGTYDAYTLLKEFFDQAREYTRTGLGDAIYLELSHDGDIIAEEDTNFERAKILWGRIELSDTDFELRFLQQDRGLITLEWEREPFWEAYTRIDATMTNDTGGPVIAVTMQNTTDGTGDNWARIHVGTATELPTPLRMEFANVETPTVGRLYMGINVKTDGNNFKHILEGTNAAVGSTYQQAMTGLETGATLVQPGAEPAAATASNDDYIRFNFTPLTAFQSFTMGIWNLLSATLEAAAGNFFRVFLVLRGDSTGGDNYLANENFEVQISLKDTFTSTVFYKSRWVGLDKRYSVQELVTIQLPPALPNVSTLQDLNLELDVRHSSTSAQQIEWDYIMLMPVNHYRKYIPAAVSTGAITGYAIIDDPYENAVYVQSGINEKVPNYHALGGPLMVHSDYLSELPRVYLIWDTVASSAKNTAELNATLTFRYFPRTEVPST